MTDSTQSPIWRRHPIHTHIEVSDLGNVRALAYVDKRGNRRSAKPRKTQLDSHGYPVIKVEGRTRKVHHLVLETFVGPRPDGMETLHGDSNPGNPALSNLRWGTQIENSQQRVTDGHDAQARRTHCLRGHVLGAPKTQGSRRGWRECKACARTRTWLRDHPQDPNWQTVYDEFNALLE